MGSPPLSMAPSSSSVASASAASSPPSAPPPSRPLTLARSLAELLWERTRLDRSALEVKGGEGDADPSALLLVASHCVEWVEWDAWEAEREQRRRDRADALEAERIVAEEERRAAEAEAKAKPTTNSATPAKGKTTTAADTKSPSPPSAAAEADPIDSSLALQLCESDELASRFVSFLLHQCLLRPDPVTRANTALLQGYAARRLGFALLQVVCQSRPAALRCLLEWLREAHGRTRAEQLRQLLQTDDTGEEDLWDIEPAAAQRSDTGFVGLKNQAATCYQNSFLQLLFHTPSFRQALMQVREAEMGDNSSGAGGAGDAVRSSSDDSSSDDVSLLARVQSIFYYLSYSSKKYLDPLAFVRSFHGYGGEPLDPCKQQDVYEFCNMLFDRLENNLDQAARLQQAGAAAAAAGGIGKQNLLKRYFGGQLQNELICSEYPAQSDHKFTRLEPFFVMSLMIKGCATLHAALHNFVASETLEGPNAYYCALCQTKRSTQKRCIVHHWPRTVIFHLKRFEFDYETMKTKKLNDELAFPLQIDLRPFTEAGMEEAEAREKAEAAAAVAAVAAATAAEEEQKHDDEAEASSDAQAEEEQQGEDDDTAHLQHTVHPLEPFVAFYPCSQCARGATHDCVECARKFCDLHEQEAHASLAPPPDAAASSGGDVPSHSTSAHSSSASAKVSPAGEADAAAGAAASTDTPARDMYRLVGVLVHSGHSEGGHYYSYIRSPTGAWHEFNDTLITPFDPQRLPAEAFGGADELRPDDGAETFNVKGKKRGKKNRGSDEWQTGNLEKSRNAYLLCYERIEEEEQQSQQQQPQSQHSDASSDALSPSPSSVDSLASTIDALSLSASSTATTGAAAAAASSSATSSASAASAAASLASTFSAFHSIPPSSLPSHLRAMHTRIERENAQQLHDQMMFERTYLDAMFKIARDNIDWLPARKASKQGARDDDKSADASAQAGAVVPSFSPSVIGQPGTRYLSDVDTELDPSDLSVMFVQQLTLFVLETVARSKDAPRLDQWIALLQHAYDAHVACCQWLLDRMVMQQDQLDAFLLHCPNGDTRKSIANLLELVVKKLIRFEIDDSFVDSLHIVLPPLKPIQKREDAQAGLAAALGSDVNAPASASSIAAASSLLAPSSLAGKSAVAQSSSSASFLSSALVQSACVSAQLAPEGIFKPTAKSTVAVSAKIAVLEGCGKGTEKQFNAAGVKTLQQLVEITPEQREKIANAPAPAMTQALLQQLVDKAQKAVDFILELSGINDKLAQERADAAERAAQRRAQCGADFSGPKLLPAFIRACNQTLRAIERTEGPGMHCCAELCAMLSNLAHANPALLDLIVEQGTVQTCVEVVISPITFVENVRREKRNKALAEKGESAAAADDHDATKGAAQPAAPADAPPDDPELAEMLAAIAASEEAEERARKEARKQRKKERMNKNPTAAAAATAGTAAAGSESNESKSAPPSADVSRANSKTSSSGSTGDDGDSDDDDELTGLEDVAFADMIGLVESLVKATTTRAAKPDEPVVPLPPAPGCTSLPAATWDALRSAPFLSRLVLAVSDSKPDPPAQLAAHLCWGSMDVTDRVLDAIFHCIDTRDFFDFYAAIKILQHLILTVHDSVHEYRVQLAMPRLLQAASTHRIYYKATELCIKAFMHLVQHSASVAAWAKTRVAEFAWMDAWFGKNRSMPQKSKDGSAPEGQCLYAVKNGRDDGVSANWEKCWNEQIEKYGIGLAASDSISDYQKIFKKMVLMLKVRK